MGKDSGSGGGWTFFKVLGFILGVIGMVGFGLCSLSGIVVMVADGFSGALDYLVFIVPGLLLTWLFFLMVRAIFRSARRYYVKNAEH